MLKTKEIIKLIEDFAPPEFAEDWDNSGWQINLGIEHTKKICLALSPSLEVVKQAAQEGCDLIITHHPLFFDKINKFSTDNITCKIAGIAIQNNIQIYSAHTNMDKAPEGLNHELAQRLGLKNLFQINDFVIQGFTAKEYSLDEFIKYIKKQLECETIRVINPQNKTTVNSVSLCTGSGSEFSNSADTDVFLTGDVKFHNALDANNKIILDIGHFESEKFVVDLFEKIFKNKDIQIFIAKEKSPWLTV